MLLTPRGQSTCNASRPLLQDGVDDCQSRRPRLESRGWGAGRGEGGRCDAMLLGERGPVETKVGQITLWEGS